MSRLMRSLWIALTGVMTAAAAPSEPGDSAIAFLEKLRTKTLNLEPGGDTAISSVVSEPKKLEIRRRYERLAVEIGSSILGVALVKQDREFASVLVKQFSISDPGQLQIIPLALVKKDTVWRVAPVLASFENTEARLQMPLKPRLKALETWMLAGQVTEMEKLKTESHELLRDLIRKSLRESELLNDRVETTLARFIKACEDKDQTLLLGLLGGISQDLPADWLFRSSQVRDAIAKFPRASNSWNLWMSKNTLKLVGPTNDQQRLNPLTVHIFDPADSRIWEMQVKVSKTSDHFWRMDLPHESTKDEKNVDENLRASFGKQWAGTHPPAPESSAGLAWSRLVKTLNQHHFSKLARLTDLTGNPKSYQEAAQFWNDAVVRDSLVRYFSPSTFIEEESSAVGIIDIFTTRDSQAVKQQAVYFEKTPTGWLWTPKPSATLLSHHQAWVTQETQASGLLWKEKWMAKIPAISAVHAGQAPGPDDAMAVIHAWLSAKAENDFGKMVSLTARLDGLKSLDSIIQNVGYELTNSEDRDAPTPPIKIYHGKFGSAVGVSGKASNPFYLILHSPQGAKILAEIDLFGSAKNGRAFLNGVALDKLRDATSAETAEDFRLLLMQYQVDLAKTLQ
jgi:hypothetical protein